MARERNAPVKILQSLALLHIGVQAKRLQTQQLQQRSQVPDAVDAGLRKGEQGCAGRCVHECAENLGRGAST